MRGRAAVYNHRQKALHQAIWRALEHYTLEWDATPEEIMEVWEKTTMALKVAIAKKKRERKKREQGGENDGRERG